jgi:hypothetical protein
MAASTKLIADMKTVIANGPSTVTQANSIAPAGPIMDYIAGCNLVLYKLEEASELLGASGALTYPHALLTETDSATDGTNLAYLQQVQAALTNLTAPSAHVIATMGFVIANGPSSVTLANAIAPAGAIMDYPGNCNLVKLKLQEAYELLSATGTLAIPKGIIFNTDSATDSTNLTLLQGVAATLS